MKVAVHKMRTHSMMRHEAVFNNRILLHAKRVHLYNYRKCYKNHEFHALGSKRRLILHELHEFSYKRT